MVMREQAFGEVFRAAADHREVNHLLQKVRAHSTVRPCEFVRTLAAGKSARTAVKKARVLPYRGNLSR
jgi:hypothetical protein